MSSNINLLKDILDKELNLEKASPGTYIEAGAHNGVFQSNTKFLDDQYGWTGLLVEPTPEEYKLCRENRPNNIIENCALVNRDYKSNTVELMYFTKYTAGNFIFSQQNLDRAYQKVIKVEARTLTCLLDKHDFPRIIDFFCLDVEGAEYLVLDGLDLNRYKIKYVLLEVSDGKRDDIPLYFNNEKDISKYVERPGIWCAIKKLKDNNYKLIAGGEGGPGVPSLGSSCDFLFKYEGSIPDIFGIKKEKFISENVNKSKSKVDISDENIDKLKRIYEIDYSYFGFDRRRGPREQALYTKNQTGLMMQNKNNKMEKH